MMIIQFTKHADTRRRIEGIEIGQVKLCLKRGAKQRQTDGYLATYSYLRVAYKRRGDTYLIKTVFVDKYR